MRARAQLAGEDELRGPDFFQADASADALVGIGDFFDDVSGEAQFQQFADRHAVAPLEHADHDAVGLGGANDVAQRVHVAEDFAAGKQGADLVPVVQIAGDLEAALRVIGDVLADVFEQRAAAHQQQAIAAHHLKGEGAEQDPPEEDGDHGEGAAHHHDADGHAQIGVDVGDQPLGEECHAHHQAKLLDQDDARFDVNLGIEIVKMQADQNAEHDQGNPEEAAVVQEKDGGIDFENDVRREDECRGHQQNLGDQERQRANWYKDLKQTNHRRAGCANGGKVNYTRDCRSSQRSDD